ncbi:MAG: flavodoxin [Bacteroides sp.]|nr:flavodoxin [Bacteroides sp.]
MKRISLISTAVVFFFAAVLFIANTEKAVDNTLIATSSSLAPSEIKGKVLVAYFTWPEPDGVDASSGASRVLSDGKMFGNTEFVANQIAKSTGGDLFAIKTSKKYPTPHKALIEDAKKEAEANERPKLTTHIKNIEEYDVIFVGYPNWWYDMPMAIYSFFDEYDFNGKTVIPFVTHEGSRFSQSVETIKNLEKGANVVQGPSVVGRSVLESKETIEGWLKSQGLLK